MSDPASGNVPPWEGSFGHVLGMRYLSMGSGEAQAELEIQPRHCNPNGVCHGGVIFAFADDSMGAAAFSVVPEGLVPTSVQVNIHFIRSCRAGDRLRVETKVVAAGRKTAFLESRVLDARQRLVALASGSYLFVEPR